MSTTVRALIHVPRQVRRGDVVEIRATVAHVMETGHRPDAEGRRVPRDIVTGFTATYNGEVVFRARLYPAISANPYLTFHTVATESGTIAFSDVDLSDLGAALPAEPALVALIARRVGRVL